MPVIGLEKAYYAVQTADSALALTYGAPKYLPGVKEIGLKPKQNTEKLYAENKLWDQATTFDSADVDINSTDLTSAQRAEILGQTIAAEGGVYASDTDKAPYVALLYKANLSGGGFRYGILYKGAFTLPDDTMKGQEGKVAYQTPKISAVFQPTQNNGMWEYHVDTTDPNCPADVDATWFTAVKIPGADTVAPTVTTVPADGAVGIAAGSSVVFTFSKAMDSSTVTDANFFLMLADGTPVTSTLSMSADYKIVTLQPAANLAAGSHVAVCTKNVKSVAGIPLAANTIVNFTV